LAILNWLANGTLDFGKGGGVLAFLHDLMEQGRVTVSLAPAADSPEEVEQAIAEVDTHQRLELAYDAPPLAMAVAMWRLSRRRRRRGTEGRNAHPGRQSPGDNDGNNRTQIVGKRADLTRAGRSAAGP
jgi:hypothetical protein